MATTGNFRFTFITQVQNVLDPVLPQDAATKNYVDTHGGGGGGGNGIPGGSNTQVQFNNNGAFDGSPGFIYDYSWASNVGLANISAVQTQGLGIGTEPSGIVGEIRATNNIIGYYSSDIRLKENIQPIDNALEKINAIRGVSFDWTDEYINKHGGEDPYFNRKHDVGVIAQEIETVLPEVVANRPDGTLAVKYDRIVALLLQGIKELNSKVNSLEEEIQQLKNKK